ncbi:MAG: hypothetical protein R3C05_08365 [Pirellulaceae bacterium]
MSKWPETRESLIQRVKDIRWPLMHGRLSWLFIGQWCFAWHLREGFNTLTPKTLPKPCSSVSQAIQHWTPKETGRSASGLVEYPEMPSLMR